ncbi:uncharacterized protein TNCV_4827191 [Trichonephila clavipes]|nr:uncharacterized protein TNCV_4827191 [Trichonephila clavipes]
MFPRNNRVRLYPSIFRKGKPRPFKLLENSVEYQLASDDDDELERIFATLEKLYDTSLDDNFEKKCRNFDSSSLPPCKAELYQHLLRVRNVTKFWRNAHLKNPSSLSPLASWWIVDDKYDFVWFAGEQFPSSAADIVIKSDVSLLVVTSQISAQALYLGGAANPRATVEQGRVEAVVREDQSKNKNY